MQLMVADTFTTRLHAACIAAKIPERGRAPELLRRLKARGNDLTVQGVRKWLDGDAIPRSEHLAELAVILNIQTDTLLTGRTPPTLPAPSPAAPGPARPPVIPEADWDALSPAVRAMIETAAQSAAAGGFSDAQAAALTQVILSSNTKPSP